MSPQKTHATPILRPSRLLASGQREKLHPTVLAEAEHRASSVQLRIADAITAFAGSMNFVYLHIVLFALWMIVFEKSPWPTLTLIVSLEAIFLSTFVMIGQNRQASFQQAKADHDYTAQERLLVENTELTRTIHLLTHQIHDLLVAEREAHASPAGLATENGTAAVSGTAAVDEAAPVNGKTPAPDEPTQA